MGAIMVMDPDVTQAWAAKQGGDLKGKSLAELCKEPKLKEAVLAECQELAKKNKFQGFEFVKAIHLEPEQWVPGGPLLTPTFKLKRKDAQDKYQKEIDEMYAALEKSAPPQSKL